MLHILDIGVDWLIEFGILAFEGVGIIVLLIAGGRAVLGYLKKGPHTSVTLARGMAMALQFKMGAEILRTVQVRDLQELALIGGIVVIRIILAFMTHYEIREGDQKRIADAMAAQEAAERAANEAQHEAEAEAVLMDSVA